MYLFESLIFGWVLMALVMLVAWERQRRTKNANAVDALWALGFSIVALTSFFRFPVEVWLRGALVTSLITLWSLRLSLYLFIKRVWGKDNEDSRYQNLRNHHGWSQKKFFVFYQAQALLVVALSIPVLISMHAPHDELRLLDVLGLVVGLVAMAGESLSDWQLSRFLSDKRNHKKTCQSGLWRYSRHPNYFFEWLHWWAYVAIGIAAPLGLLTLIGPALMLWFLLKLTGVGPAERSSLQTRSDYAGYQKSTSMFIPWLPKKLRK
jgi:steroid 5-alpha reductase family enzyme